VSHWDPALDAVGETSSGIYGPRSFTDYLQEAGLDPGQHRTAAELSIDTRSQLPDRLAERDTMVLHLGRATDGPGPQFALVSVPNRLEDFFIDEREFYADSRETLDYTPDGDDHRTLGQEVRDMLALYRSLPTFSERGFVNLALSTGLLSRALGLDGERLTVAPAAVASSFSFEFEPHPDRPTLLRHNDGQIGIDTLVVTRRNGERVLLVIEAKCGGRVALAKHTLGYQVLAAETSLSLDVDRVVPVYLRARPAESGVRYSIYECSELRAETDRPCLAGLHVVDDSHYEMRI
jgi:hypothetical protein